jgi:hypothetical protein
MFRIALGLKRVKADNLPLSIKKDLKILSKNTVPSFLGRTNYEKVNYQRLRNKKGYIIYDHLEGFLAKKRLLLKIN